MKNLPHILVAGSLALNVALAWLLIGGLRGRPAASSDAPPKPVVAVAPSTGPSEVDPDIWPSLQADDLGTLVSRLRAAGFPTDVVRAIVSAQLGEAYRARSKALDPDEETRPFWKTRVPDPTRDLALRQLGREHEKQLRALLGEEGVDPFSSVYQDRQLTGVPRDKVDQVRQLLTEFGHRRSDIYAAGAFAADREKVAAIDREQQAALAQVLTPAELADYNLRHGSTANQLRYELTAFNTTEAEFRLIHDLTKPFNERFAQSMSMGASQEERRTRAEAHKQLTEQIKTALGPVRGEEYGRAIDHNYRQTSQLVTRLELPPEAAQQVWSVQSDIQERSRAIYGDRALTPEQRNQQLANLNSEAKTKITATLGTRGFDAYQQYGGQWMQNLKPRPAPLTAPTPPAPPTAIVTPGR